MKIKKLSIKFTIFFSICVLLLSYAVPSVGAFTNSNNVITQNDIKVDIKQIKELAESNQFYNSLNLEDSRSGTPAQILADTVAAVVSSDTDHGFPYFAIDVMKYLYPDTPSQELKNKTITAEQAVSWLNSVGYTATIVNRALTTEEIKKKLDEAAPIVTILDNQNEDYWLEPTTAGVIYAHNDIVSPNGEMHQSFMKSVSHEEAPIIDGNEAGSFKFPDTINHPDETARANSYLWVQTITDIKKDSSWNNSENIREDRKEGIFNVNLQKEGENVVQAEFTDADVQGLSDKHPQNTTEKTTKLAAVGLINLYLDEDHQETVANLESFSKISAADDVSIQNIKDWYSSLGFVFESSTGKITKEQTKALNSAGKPYFSFMKAVDASNKVQNTSVIGAGFTDNNMAYTPRWLNVKAWEQISVGYKIDWNASNAMELLQEAMRKFSYDKLTRLSGEWGENQEGDFVADTMIYNIRAKEVPSANSSSFTATSSNSPRDLETSIIASTVGSNYVTNPNFGVRETQGEEPWCLSYTNAAAVNTLIKDTSDEGIASAKKIMQVIHPGVSDEELLTMSGESIGAGIEALQKGYNVTVDYEERVLSFEEVKKELDAGKPVGFDGWTEISEENPESIGHSLSIVGYVLPSDGDTVKHTPYYEVWNPWWKKTLYVSAKATGVRLSGLEFKWKNSWHNYRKIETRSLPKIDEKLFDITAPQFGNPVMQRANFMGTNFGYADSKDGKYLKAIRNDSHKTVAAGTGYDFKSNIQEMKTSFYSVMGVGLSIAIISAVVVFFPAGSGLLTFINWLNSAAGTLVGQTITGILGLPGNFKTGLLAAFMVSLVAYIWNSRQAESLYGAL